MTALYPLRWRLALLTTLIVLCLGDPVGAASIDTGSNVDAGTGAESRPDPVPSWPQLTVAAVSFTDQADLDELANRLDLLEKVDRSARTVDALLRPDEIERLRAEGRTVTVDLAQSATLNRPRPASPSQTSGIPGFACYRTVEETYASMEQLVAARPDLATWTDVGDSWDKITPGGNSGYDIFALVLTNRAIPGPKPKLFIISAIHAREYATAELTTRFAEDLVNNYGLDPEITWLLDYNELHLIPQANPDGRKQAEGGLSWRKNVDNDDGCTTYPYFGVDLNRNSTFMWNQGGSSGFSCDEVYRGPSAGSEPEVQAIESYARAIFPDQRGSAPGDAAPDTTSGVFLTIHSYGQLVLYPWGYTTTDAPNGPGLATLGRKFGFFNDYTVCQDCLYAVSGATDDFVYGELGVPSYTFEIGTTFFQSCFFFEQSILPRNMPALRYALKAARQPYQEPSGPEVFGVTLPAAVVAGEPVTLTATADDTRFDSNGYGTEPFQNVVAARYAINTPPWADGAAFFPMHAVDGSLNQAVEALTATLDTSGWLPGRSIVYVQAQDGAGRWGMPTAAFLDIAPPPYYFAPTPPPAQVVAPGRAATHALLIQNAGTLTDSYTLTLSSPITWPVQMAGNAGPLAPGATAKVRLTVSAPVTAPHGASLSFTVSVRSVGDPSGVMTVPVTTTVQINRGVTATPMTSTLVTGPERPVTVTLTVQNTGNVTDSFGLTYTSTEQIGWTVNEPPTVTLGAGERATVHLRVQPPPGLAEGSYAGQIQATSAGDSAVFQTAAFTVQISWPRTYLPSVVRQADN